MALREQVRGLAPQLSAAVPVWMLLLVVLAVILTAAQDLGLSATQSASWVFALFALPALLGVLTSFLWQQPMLWTPHLLAVILFASLAADGSFAEFAGASIVAGAAVVILALTGVTGRVTSLIPPAVVMGLIAGVVAPFVWRMFTALGTAPVVVGSVLVAYAVSQRLLGPRIPPIFPALAAGVLATGLTGQFGPSLPAPSLPAPVVVLPEFSADVLAATVPVLVVLMTLQTNVPWVIYLRTQGYEPPERLINFAGGATTVAGALLGPIAMSSAVGAAPLVAGPGAGPRERRHRAVYAISAVGLLIAIGSTMAAPLAAFVPPELIVSVAGLALLGVLVGAVGDMVGGPVRLGPVVAFVVALSDISLLGLGPFFWSLVLGAGVSRLLEPDGWAQLRPAG